MFEAESLALDQLYEIHRSSGSLRVPKPHFPGATESASYIVMEYLDIGKLSAGDNLAWTEAGRQLARVHKYKPRTPHFGWHCENTIGSTPQINTHTQNWIEFYKSHRLAYQFHLASQKGFLFPQSEILLDSIDSLFDDYDPMPSFLHGDLWYGNIGFTPDSQPCIFDPASYYGDREAEFGIIDMFGGFPESFFEAYNEVWPLSPSFHIRLPIYRLYHELNHLNLFGSGYLSSVESTISQILGRRR